LYVGALGWPPNASAARFLAVEVLPLVRRRVPGARLLIVGKNPPAELLALAEGGNGVQIAGNVPDVVPYFLDADVLAVPLETGGGTRLKILEAFAAGLPVVSTPVGCEGIDATDGEHLVVADRPAFAERIAQLLIDPARHRGLMQQARQLARQRYDWAVVGALAATAVVAAARSAPIDSRRVPSLAIPTRATIR
jgi:glycosyltransferase involved in cell wall biosynthesis